MWGWGATLVDSSISGSSNRRIERRVLVGDMLMEFKRRPELSVIIALLWAWTRMVFGTSSFDSFFAANAFSDAYVKGIVVLANAIAYLLIAILFRLKKIVPRGRFYWILIAFFMAFGAVSFFAPLPASIVFGVVDVTHVLGAVMLGVGCACFYVELGRILGHCGSASALIHTVVGVAGSAILLCLFHIAPLLLLNAYLVLSPFALVALSFRWLEVRSQGLYACGNATKSYVPWRLLITAAFAGVAFGVALQIPQLGNYFDPPLLRNAVTLAVTASVLLCAAVLFRMDFNQLIYRIGFPLLAFGFVLYLTARSSCFVGGFVFSVGYYFLDLLFWILLAHIINKQNVSANWIVALALGALLLGRAIGDGIFSVASILIWDAGEAGKNLLIVVLFVLLVNALFMLDARNLSVGWGVVRPVDQLPCADEIEIACMVLRKNHALTPREMEVCALLARGHSRKRVSVELGVSEETVRTHAANVFRKLDVHSHQELIVLVEKRVAVDRLMG